MPKCGAPVKNKTSRVTWLFLIFVVLLVYGVTTTEKNTPPLSVEKENTAVKPIDTMTTSRDKVQSLFQSKNEPVAKDALWTSNNIFKVGVIDDGTLRNGYALYVCNILYEHGFKGKEIWVQVIDIVKLTQDNDWVKLGESHCL